MLLGGVAVSCRTSDDPDSSARPEPGFAFEAEIADFDTPGSRANITDVEDLWSFKSFSEGDVSGFYARYGNMLVDDGMGSFSNVPMYYDRRNSTFYNNDIEYNTDNFQYRQTFYYYPYNPNIDYRPDKKDFDPEDNYGWELRMYDEKDDIYKCRDLLWLFSESNATAAKKFAHAFSSIIILRGEGFKDADNREVKVVLEKGFSHVTVIDSKMMEPDEEYLKNVMPIYLDHYKIGDEEWTEKDCREWQAWDGAPYFVDDKDSPYFEDTFNDAQYVILPTMRGGNGRTKVDHIEIYDDNEQLHIVTNFTLYTSGSNTKILAYGERYPLVIKMEDNEVVVQPIGIYPWDGDEVIQETRATGIGNETDFNDWVLTYNKYVNEGRPQDTYDDELKKYGDQTIHADNSVEWTFYLNNDLDLSKVINGSQQYVLQKFDDTFEGYHHSISGISLSGQYPPAFIGEVGVNGKIRNLDFRGLDITYTGDATAYIGGLFHTFRGVLEYCNVDGVVNSTGPAGIIAGEALGATVKGCTIKGLVIAPSTSLNGLFGSSDADCSVSSSNAAGLIFQTN